MFSVGHLPSLHVRDEKHWGSRTYLLNHKLWASKSQLAHLMEILRTFWLNTSLLLIREMSTLLCATPWTVAHQVPLAIELSRQEYWSGCLALLQENLPDPGIKPTSLRSPALAVGLFTTSTTWEAPIREMSTIFKKIFLLWKKNGERPSFTTLWRVSVTLVFNTLVI